MTIQEYFKGQETISLFIRDLKHKKDTSVSISFKTFEYLYVTQCITTNYISQGKRYDSLMLI